MIKNDFYNDPDWIVERGGGVFTKPIYELSNTYGAIVGAETDWAAPYYMGYIPWSKFPRQFTPFTISINNEDKTITFNNLCENTNIPWFYSMIRQSSGSNISYAEMLIPQDSSSASSLWKNTGVNGVIDAYRNTGGHYLINEMEMPQLTQGGTFTLYYLSFKVDQVTGVSDIYSGLIDLTFSQMKDFFEGNGILTLDIAGQSTLDVSSSMIADNDCLIYSGDTYKYVFMCGGISLPHKMTNPGQYKESGYGFSLHVGFKLPVPDKNSGSFDFNSYYIPNGKMRAYGTGTSWYNAPSLHFRRDSEGSQYTFQASYVPYYDRRFYGGLTGNVSFSDFPDDPGSSKPEYNWDERGYLFETSHPYNVDARMYWSVPWRETYNFILLLNKFDETTGGYPAASSTYDLTHPVTMFNSNDAPTGESVNETYTRVEPKLREWQKVGKSISDDEFDVDNMPPDEPSGGGDDPGSDDPVETPLITGDDQELQPNRTLGAPLEFITPYLITPPILSIFGRTLWTSLANYDPQDPTSVDVFKNFFAILNEEVTGSLDIGSMLSFIVSVRQYPFNVASLNIIQSAGNTISFGTGKVPINCGSAAVVYKLTSTIGLLDCGSLTIADYKDFKLYNDFRDYLNASVSAYLPYCGTVELNPVEVIHNTLHCYYAIDFYTGECTAYITCTDGNHEWISAIKNGIIGVLLPITATNSGQVSARHLSDNAKDSSLIASAVGSMFGAIGNIATGNVMGAASNITGLAQIGASQKMLQAERQGRSAVMSPSLSGGSGAAAFFQPSCASVLVRRGTYARHKISNYPQSCGYPSTTSGILSSFSGYTECYNVDVDGINCTEEERAAIKTILETGVYL